MLFYSKKKFTESPKNISLPTDIPKRYSNMKTITLFYQERCPFCKKAFRYIEELKEEYPEFSGLRIETIEETRQPELADQYDYYYVPTFYIDGQKEHEGGIYKDEVEVLLRKALE